jgi:hypothetical protein
MVGNMLKMFMLGFILVTVGVVNAGTGQLNSYYGECIDREILQCQRKAAFIACESESLRRWARVHMLKAKYYKINKEELIGEMVAQRLDPEQYKIEYFLNKSFYNHYDRVSLESKISE